MGLGSFFQWFSVIFCKIDGFGFAHALTFVVDHDAFEVSATEADLNFAGAQVTRGFETNTLERKGVVFKHGTVFFHKEKLVVGFVRGEKSDAGQIKSEAVDGPHFQNGVNSCVIFVFGPGGKSSI